jgi:CP family cyanate transporter-like MFS transporter
MLGGSWSLALGAWALPAILVAMIWFPHAFFRKVRMKHAGFRVEGLWRDRLAWQVTLFMGLQSALAYCVFGWLSPILRDRGLDGVPAGAVVSVSVMAQVFACLLVPSIAVRCKDQRLINVTLVGLAVIGLLGFLFAPLSTVWLWAVIQGIGQGGLIAVAMTIIVLRSGDAHIASHLSGMAQCVGYMLAAIGPLLVGLIHSLTGSYSATAILFVLLGFGVAIFGWGAGSATHVKARTIQV